LLTQTRAPRAALAVVVQTPPENLDIWTLWSRLYDHDHAAFDRNDPEAGGIFPLDYLRGVSATYVLLGKTDEEVSRLRSVLESCVSEPPATKSLEQSGEIFDEDVRRIWCCGPRPESMLAGQRYNLPHRFLSILRPEKDLVILPKGLTVGVEFLSFIQDVLGITDDQVRHSRTLPGHPDAQKRARSLPHRCQLTHTHTHTHTHTQIIWTSGESFCLDDDMTVDVIAKLKSIITSSPNDKFMFVPYVLPRPCWEYVNSTVVSVMRVAARAVAASRDARSCSARFSQSIVGWSTAHSQFTLLFVCL
jgi:hypothetical protein